MPFQIVLQTYKRTQGEITFFTAGPDQIVICNDFITLEATVQGDLTGNSFLWEQIGGTPVTVNDANTLIATFTNNDLSPKIFRFFINKGTASQQFDDITVFATPLTNASIQTREDTSTFRSKTSPVSCSSIINTVDVVAPEPIDGISGQTDSTNEIVFSWDEQSNEGGELVGNILGIEDIETPDIHYLPAEISGSLVFDRRGVSNGIAVGNVTAAHGGEFGRMFVFNGGYIDIPAPFFEPELKRFTFSCLIQPDVVHEGAQEGTIVCISEDLITITPRFNLSIVNGGLSLTVRTDINNEITINTNPNIITNSLGLIPIVVTLEEINATDKRIKVFVQSSNVLNQIITLAGDISTLQYSRIGINQVDTNPFIGNLDQVRFYDSAISDLNVGRILNEQNFYIEPDQIIPNTNPSSVYKAENHFGDQVIDTQSRVNGNLIGDVTFVEGKNGLAFDLDGTQTGIDCSTVCLGTVNDLTFSCYFSTRNVVDKRDILHFSEVLTPLLAPSTAAMILSVDGSEIRCRIQKDGIIEDVVTTFGPISLNTFYHIALTVSVNGNYDVYLDGNLILSGTTPGAGSFIMPLCNIGISAPPGLPFDGLIEDIRFFSKKITQTEVQVLSNKPIDSFKFIKTVLPTAPQEVRGAVPFSSLIISENPVSYWQLNEETGFVANDYTSLNDGGIQGAPLLRYPGITSDGYSMKFDGIGDYITTNEFNIYDFIHQTGVFTVQAWFQLDDCKADKINAICGTCFNDPTLEVGFALYCDNRSSQGSPYSVRFLFATGDANFILLTADGAARDNLPHKVSVVGNGSDLKLYIDDVLYDQQALPSLPFSGLSNHTLDIGDIYDVTNTQYVPNAKFQGRLSNLAIFDKALTVENIEKIYFSGRYNLLNRIVIKSLYKYTKYEKTSLSCIKDFSEVTLPTSTYVDEVFRTSTNNNPPPQINIVSYNNSSSQVVESVNLSTIANPNEIKVTERFANNILQTIDNQDVGFGIIYTISYQRFTPGSL